MTLKLYNTMGNKEEEFEPLEDDLVRMYTCGQTIYEDMHVGNAKTYAVWDVLKRYLKWKGCDVFHVMNITDVGHLTDDADQGEDKVEKAAREKKMEPMELVTRQVLRFYREMDALNMEPADVIPRATGHMIEMIEGVKSIMENGYGYEKNGSVYFDVMKFYEDHGYPELGGRKIEDMRKGAGGRVSEEEMQEKNSPLDFALWIKAAPEHIMKWPSPWSLGYPGWHLECSVMSTKYLGKIFDIHGGGVDHIFPHHPNERAQNMAMNNLDEEPVKFWLHSEHISVEGEKMSKSEGNFYTVSDLLDDHSGEVIRAYYASIHYRTQADFSLGSLEEADKKLDRFYNTMRLAEAAEGGNGEELQEHIKSIEKEFEAAMDDDLNTPLAMSKLIDFSKKINKNLDNKKELIEEAVDKLEELGRVLGLTLESREKEAVEADEFIRLLLKIRQRMREKKEYEIADEIRDELGEMGVVVEDKEEGPGWHWK